MEPAVTSDAHPSQQPPWIDRFLEGHRDELVAFRRRLHAHPEVSRHEHRTTEAIIERLAAAGLEPTIVSTGTGVVCDIGTGHRTVALRADIDGLAMADTKDVSYRSKVDGVAHGCGHDLHTTIVMGAGLALAEQGVGRVRLIFEPAEEEVPGGALDVIADGALVGVDAIFGFHADPKLDVGTVGVRTGALTSSADLVELTLHGPGGHTARPQLTVDLVAVAGRVAAELPGRVAAGAASHGSLSLVFGAIRAGDAANVIPTEAVLRGSLRSPDPGAHDHAPRIIDEELRKLVEPLGATFQLTYRRGVPPVLNDADLSDVMRDAVRGALGRDALVEPPRSAGGDTFAWYLEHVPGCYGRLGVHDPERTERLDLHSGAFDVHEGAIDVGVRVMIAAALMSLGGGR